MLIRASAECWFAGRLVAAGAREPAERLLQPSEVVNTTPPAATDSSSRKCTRDSACTGGWRRSSRAAREGPEELIVQVVAFGEYDERRALH